ncbi:MAG: sulfite exporter TauE/SafE family protein [Gammaproteobacteria bacterium]|nr:sulfite exporter TauE/SafE family protein [Gammaproteobacteria bacterium]
MSVAATALSVPALFALGLASSPHCALMCAPLAQLGSRPGHGLDTMRLHLGRLSAYMLLGAIAGALGGGILWQMERLGLLSGLRWAAAIGLVLLAGWRWRTPGQQPACCTPTPAAGRRLPAYVRGLLWGLLPCGLLYGVLGLAALSGGGVHGAALSLAFGIGASPLLLASGRLGRMLRARVPRGLESRLQALLLLASGVWIVAWTPASRWIAGFCG